MLIAKIKFGETHAVTELGDAFKGKRPFDLACAPGQELNADNKSRYTFLEQTPDHVGCATCRHKMGLDDEAD